MDLRVMAEPPASMAAAETDERQRLREQLDDALARERLLQLQVAQLQGELQAQLQAARPKRLPRFLAAALRRAANWRARTTPRPQIPHDPQQLEHAKQALRARMEADLAGLLRGPQRLVFAAHESPQISILLVLFNQAPLTYTCLRAILANTTLPNATMKVELIIVDNASTDQTDALLARIDGAKIIRNEQNRHFLAAVNQAAGLAVGENLLLLNNDAAIRNGALEAAFDDLAENADIGAVGGMIILPDGSLQEAGSIIFGDGTCAGYGRGQHPTLPEFHFMRDVDFCSGAFLLLRRSLFEALDGLDTAYAPAYYEETDFCMRLRSLGYRIVYDPRIVIDHYEFASSRSSDHALALQKRNHAIFLDHHRAVLLAEHATPGTSHLLARMRGPHRRVLLIEDRVPFPSLGAGYPRSAQMLHSLVQDGWFVTLYPLLFPEAEWQAVQKTFSPTIEVMLGLGEAGLAEFLKSRAEYYDRIIVCRPHNMRLFLQHGGADVDSRIIYDAEAVFSARDFLRLELEGRPASKARQQAQLQAEMDLVRAADTVITVSPAEHALFVDAGCDDIKILGHTIAPEPTQPAFASRRDFFFVGALDDDPSPNTDALLWFCAEIRPLLDRLIGADYRLVVAGRCGAARVQALAGPRVLLLGRVDDITPWYAQSRLFIAPTRYAGGIPLKILESASRGLPVVATSLLGRQLGWTDGDQLLLADTPADFAAACARLYSDEKLWHHIRAGALAKLAIDADATVFRDRLAAIMEPATRSANRRTPPAARVAPARTSRPRSALRRVRGIFSFLYRNGWAGTWRRLQSEWQLRLGRRDYATWIRLYDTLRADDPAAIKSHIATFARRPTFSLVLTPNAADDAALAATVRSLTGQIYDQWELCVPAGQALDLDPRIRQGAPPTGDFVLFLHAGDILRPHSLYMFAAELDLDPDLSLIYCDEDQIEHDTSRRFNPLFKADYDSEMLRGPDFLDQPCVIRRDLAEAVGGDFAAGDLTVRVAERCDRDAIGHIPRILIHRSALPPASAPAQQQRVVADHLRRIGIEAAVELRDCRVHVAYPLPTPPLVSVIIPTRDRVALLRRCVQGLLSETDYPFLQIIIVDNGSVEPRSRKLLERLALDERVKVVLYSQEFNYAAMNNLAVREADGEMICLLNNDIAIRDPGWLREMVSLALRPDVGAVGAKLFYADGSVQHAGVVTGIHTVAGHIFRHAPHDAEGYAGRLQRVQSLSCVTGACMVVRRSVYLEEGGLDEINLAVSYNDVDFCLRLKARGLKVIFTPFAELDHLESVTRGRDDSAANIDRARREAAFMARKWGAALGHDPAYNPNLTHAAEDFSLAFPPRVGWPWRAT
jgi:GT2 family glycosyltransferase